jgi:hypothetical protein
MVHVREAPHRPAPPPPAPPARRRHARDGRLSPAAVLALQRTAGNGAAVRLLQRAIAQTDVPQVREYFERRVGEYASVTSRKQRAALEGILRDADDVDDAKRRIDAHVRSLAQAIDGRGPDELRQRGRLGVRNFVPRTRMGMFDADYDPVAGRLDVNVRVAFNFNFESWPEGQGVVKNLWQALSLFARSVVPAWAEDDAATWRRTFIAEVGRAWSGRHKFVANEFGWDLPDVRVVVNAVDAGNVRQGAHFEVVVHRQYDQTRLYSAYNDTEQLFDPNVQRQVHYQQHDLQTTPHGQAASEVSGRTIPGLTLALKKIATDTREAGDHDQRLYLLFAPTGGLTPASVLKLNEVVKTFSRVEPGLARLVLHYADDAHRDAVAGRLAAFTVRPEKADGLPGVYLRVEADPAFQPAPYSTAVHEFGHMLGNVDLYRDEAVQLAEVLRRNPQADVRVQTALAQAQTHYMQLVSDAGLQARAPLLGLATSDVMSMGDRVMPTDYLTLWEALTQITSPEVQHWRVG